MPGLIRDNPPTARLPRPVAPRTVTMALPPLSTFDLVVIVGGEPSLQADVAHALVTSTLAALEDFLAGLPASTSRPSASAGSFRDAANARWVQERWADELAERRPLPGEALAPLTNACRAELEHLGHSLTTASARREHAISLMLEADELRRRLRDMAQTVAAARAVVGGHPLPADYVAPGERRLALRTALGACRGIVHRALLAEPSRDEVRRVTKTLRGLLVEPQDSALGVGERFALAEATLALEGQVAAWAPGGPAPRLGVLGALLDTVLAGRAFESTRPLDTRAMREAWRRLPQGANPLLTGFRAAVSRLGGLDRDLDVLLVSGAEVGLRAFLEALLSVCRRLGLPGPEFT